MGKEREERNYRKPKNFKKEMFEGCSVTGMKCDGVCREHYYKTCPEIYNYYLEPVFKVFKITEQNPKPRRVVKRFRKVECK